MLYCVIVLFLSLFFSFQVLQQFLYGRTIEFLFTVRVDDMVSAVYAWLYNVVMFSEYILAVVPEL